MGQYFVVMGMAIILLFFIGYIFGYRAGRKSMRNKINRALGGRKCIKE